MSYTSDQVRAVEEARAMIDRYGFGFVEAVSRFSGASPQDARWALMEMCTPPDEESEPVATFSYQVNLKTGAEKEIWWGTSPGTSRRVPLRLLSYLDPPRAEAEKEKQQGRILRARKRLRKTRRQG